MAPIWRDVYAENYYKALNRRAVTLKQVEAFLSIFLYHFIFTRRSPRI